MKICRIRIRQFVILIFFTTIYMFAFHIVISNLGTQIPPLNLKYVVVHLDLKGSPPKLSYLQTLLPLLKQYGVNGLLMEYEDMFPYEGKLVNLSARNAYKKYELENFVIEATRSGFEIIPLIQTFGHLEFALKLAEFKKLRENPLIPDSICPSLRESRELLTDMLTQVILFHKKIAPLKYIHIGCDEVNLNKCELCRSRSNTNLQIFSSHFKFITKVVGIISPFTEILFWDDMLRQVKPREFYELKFNNSSPVYWSYTDGDLSGIHPTLYKYQKGFTGMWVATAFKGADGADQTLPVLRKRFINHWKWLEFMLDHGNIANRYSFKGIILTGWSRYAHMQPLCELLPASIPSLILNLIVIQKYSNGEIVERFNFNDELTFVKKYVHTDFNKVMNCYGLDEIMQFDAKTCNFDGAGLYNVIEKYTVLKLFYQERVARVYHIGHQKPFGKIEDVTLGNVNMDYARYLMNWCEVGLNKLSTLELDVAEAMVRYYDEYVVNEYVFFHIQGLKRKLKDLYRFMEDNNKVKVWSRGPTNISYERKSSLPVPV